jgi:hypothetical protein
MQILKVRSGPLYSARKMAKPVNFYYANRDAKLVSLIGDLNQWNPVPAG